MIFIWLSMIGLGIWPAASCDTVVTWTSTSRTSGVLREGDKRAFWRSLAAAGSGGFAPQKVEPTKLCAPVAGLGVAAASTKKRRQNTICIFGPTVKEDF